MINNSSGLVSMWHTLLSDEAQNQVAGIEVLAGSWILCIQLYRLNYYLERPLFSPFAI